MPLLLGAAVGVPYVASNGPNIDQFLSSNAGPKSSQVKPNDELRKQLQASEPKRAPLPQGPGSTLYPTETPLEGMPALSLHEVFNLNVTKEWVYQRWARKSTALSELGLFGIRVPLVTGTQLHDLAGSLTYFFGNDGRVSRISFHGTTGDTSQLVMLAAQQYGLQQQSTPVANEQLFQIKKQNQVFSELRTRTSPVLWSSSPHDSFAVDFELQRPGVATPLPSRLPQLPIVKTPPPQQQKAAAQSVPTSSAKRVENSDNSSQTVDPAEKWKPFFPRSRVPNKQVDNLDRHRRMW